MSAEEIREALFSRFASGRSLSDADDCMDIAADIHDERYALCDWIDMLQADPSVFWDTVNNLVNELSEKSLCTSHANIRKDSHWQDDNA